MTEDKHEFLLRLPETTFQILKKYKDVTGISITGSIHEAIISWCFLKKLISLEEISNGNKK